MASRVSSLFRPMGETSTLLGEIAGKRDDARSGTRGPSVGGAGLPVLVRRTEGATKGPKDGKRVRLGARPLAVALSLLGCQNADPVVPRPISGDAALTVVVTTDLAIPQDLDAIEVEVEEGGRAVARQRRDLAPTLAGTGAVFDLTNLSTREGPFDVKATGYQRRVPVVLVEARVLVPQGSRRRLKLPLSFLCRGRASIVGIRSDGAPQSACPPGLTCQGGRCGDASAFEVEEGTSLQTEGDSSSGSCFNALACFDGAPRHGPTLDGQGQCVLSAGVGAPGPHRGALGLATSSGGFCSGDGVCFVPLVEGPGPSEAKFEGGHWVLPYGACTAVGIDVVVSPRCAPPTASMPPCGGASRAEGPGPLPDDVPSRPPPDGAPFGNGRRVEGTVSGVEDSGLVLALNDEDELAVGPNEGHFSFESGIEEGAEFKVTVRRTPFAHRCRVERGVGRGGSGAESQVSVVCAAFAPVSSLAPGYYHACAVLRDGTLRCWGNNSYGQTDNGRADSSIAGLTRVVGATAGHGHTCALIADGTVRCWGSNRQGQLGWDGTVSGPTLGARGSVVEPVPNLRGVSQLASGHYHTCALLDDGTVRCWGDVTATDGLSSTRESVAGLSGVRQIEGGGFTTCALLSDGSVRCWGSDANGQRAGSSSTAGIPGLSGVTQVSVGTLHACALRKQGTVRCWGNNDFGQTAGANPQEDIPGLSGVVQVDAGKNFTCARLSGGTVRCWGEGRSTQTGGGSLTDDVPGISGSTLLASGEFHACSVATDGLVRCWGDNAEGQKGGTGDRVVLAGLSGAMRVATGVTHTCVALGDGTVRCWGNNFSGQCGDSSRTRSISGLSGVVDVVARGWHTCVLRVDGTVRCWGYEESGATAGATTTRNIPGLSGVTQIDSGRAHTCVALRDGTVRCWGQNDFGEGGINSPFVSIPGLEGTSRIVAGHFHSCVLFDVGTVQCWGDNSWNQLGGTDGRHPLAGLSGVLQLAAGHNHTCALLPGGFVRCWGDNIYVQTAGSSPTESIVGLSGVVQVAGGRDHTCVVLTNGTVRCWGLNQSGQTQRGTPTRSLQGITGIVSVATGTHHTCALDGEGTVQCWGDDTYGQVSGEPHTLQVVALLRR